MKLPSYNHKTDPLAPIIRRVLNGEEIELPVKSKKQGNYIRQRLSAIFSWYAKTNPVSWRKPIPHLVKEDWDLGGGLSGEWKVRVDWINKKVKYSVVTLDIGEEI